MLLLSAGVMPDQRPALVLLDPEPGLRSLLQSSTTSEYVLAIPVSVGSGRGQC